MPGDNPNMPVGTASVSWVDDAGPHVRVFSTDGYYVYERCQDGGVWTSGALMEPCGQVSATCWQEADGVHIRVYCNFQDKTVEYCSDAGNGWYQGDFTTVPQGPPKPPA